MMNTAGRSMNRPGGGITPAPAGLSPVPFSGFSPSPNLATATSQGRGVLNTPGVNVPPATNRPQQLSTGGQTPGLQMGSAPRSNPPLPPRSSSATKPASIPASRLAATPGSDATLRPPQPSSSFPARTPTPPASTAGALPALGKAPMPTGASAGSKVNKKRQSQSAGSNPGSMVRTAEITPAPKRKKKKPADKHIPERVVAVVPESAIYNQLLELEKHIDSTLLRKKQDIQEALRNPPRVPRILRLYVTNTYANQGPQGSLEGEPSWTLNVTGRILEALHEVKEGEGDLKTQGAKAQTPMFSSFLRRLTVELDPVQYRDQAEVTWEAAKAPAPVDGFEVRRIGSKEFTAKLKLDLNYNPQRFQLSAKLASLIGTELETRPRIIASLWQYIKAKKLQNPSDPTTVNCDAALRELFGEARMKMASMTVKLHPHLAAPQPVTIEHLIKLSGPSPAIHACYDITVDLPAPLQKEMSDYLSSLEKHRDIDELDALISSDVQKVNEHRKRRSFFLGFSKAPVDFIYGLMASQHRDLRQAAGDTERDHNKERRSDFYKQPWVEDAVLRYLNRRPAATAD